MTSQTECWLHQSENRARRRRLLPNLVGTFAKLRKATISFVTTVCLSVCPSVLLCLCVSVRMELPGSHETEILEMRYLCIFPKSVEKLSLI
jgi:hypothetical protein